MNQLGNGVVSLTADHPRLVKLALEPIPSCSKRLPHGQVSRATDFVNLPIDAITFGVELVVKRGLDGGEHFHRLHVPKLYHCSHASSEREMAVLGPIVQPAAGLLAVQISKFTHRSRVRFDSIGHDGFGLAVTLQRIFQNDQSRQFIALPIRLPRHPRCVAPNAKLYFNLFPVSTCGTDLRL
jgi:hypothetical protein